VNFISLILAVALPILVAVRIYRNQPNRMIAANWFLCVFAVPMIIWVLGLAYFALFRTSLFDLIDVMASLLSAAVAATFMAARTYIKRRTRKVT